MLKIHNLIIIPKAFHWNKNIMCCKSTKIPNYTLLQELSSLTLRYQKHKKKTSKENLKQSYIENCSTWSIEWVCFLLSSESEEENDTVPENLKLLYQAYQTAESENQRSKLWSNFLAQKNRAEQVRKWRNTFDYLNFNGQGTFARNRMN